MKNMHGVEIIPAEKQIAEITAEIGEKIALIARLNEEGNDIERACVELAALHCLFGRKHAIMRRQRAGRMNLDRYAQKGEGGNALA